MLARLSASELIEWAAYYALEEQDRKRVEAEGRR